jgi:hypothetical protein
MLRQFIQLRRFNELQLKIDDEIAVRITGRMRESVDVTVKTGLPGEATLP